MQGRTSREHKQSRKAGRAAGASTGGWSVPKGSIGAVCERGQGQSWGILPWKWRRGVDDGVLGGQKRGVY